MAPLDSIEPAYHCTRTGTITGYNPSNRDPYCQILQNISGIAPTITRNHLSHHSQTPSNSPSTSLLPIPAEETYLMHSASMTETNQNLDIDEMNWIDLDTVEEVVFGAISHSFSKKWLSEIEKESKHLSKLLPALLRLAPDSFLIPQDLRDWITHRLGINYVNQLVLNKRIQARINARTARRVGRCKIGPSFRGKEFESIHSPVLAQMTIWNSWSLTMDKSCADWPSSQEMKWEGDDRRKTDVGRYLPLPREPGNETVAWHHLKVVPTYELDAVRRLQDITGLEAPEVSYDDEPGRMFLGNLLWNTMDNPL